MNATTQRQSTVLTNMIHHNLEGFSLYRGRESFLGVYYAPSGISRHVNPDLVWANTISDDDISPSAHEILDSFPVASLLRVRQSKDNGCEKLYKSIVINTTLSLYSSMYPKWGALSEGREIDLRIRYRYRGSAWTLAGVMITPPNGEVPSTNQANGLSI